jgi:hypothetical protein
MNSVPGGFQRLLTMVYNTRGLLGFWTSSVLQYSKEHKRTQRFGKWVCFRPQEGWETATLLGLLERANLGYWTTSPEDGNRISFRNVVLFVCVL